MLDLNKPEEKIFANILNDLPSLKKSLIEAGASVKNFSAKMTDSGKDIVKALQQESYIRKNYAEVVAHMGEIIENMIPDIRDQANAMNMVHTAAKSQIDSYLSIVKETEKGNRQLAITKGAFSTLNEVISSFGLKIPMTIGAVVSSMLAFDALRGKYKERAFAAAPAGVYGTQATGDINAMLSDYTVLLRKFKLKSEEITTVFSDLNKSGMSTGGAFDELGKRAVFTQMALAKGINEQTADTFYRNVTLKMGRKSEDGARALSFLSEESLASGTSMESYTQILNEMMSSTGALGAQFEDLVAYSARYATDLKEGKIALSDFNKMMALKEAPAGKQIGTVMLAKQLGIPLEKGSALRGLSPMEVPLAIASGKVGGPELERLQRAIVDNLASKITKSSGISYEASRLQIAQQTFGMTPTAAYTMLHPSEDITGRGIKSEMAGRLVTSEMLTALESMKKTTGLLEKAQIGWQNIGDKIMSLFDKPIVQRVKFEPEPVEVPLQFKNERGEFIGGSSLKMEILTSRE